ncbi:MAG TPA: hypothetical protein VGC92_12815, partial [Phenylobacterium sp.]
AGGLVDEERERLLHEDASFYDQEPRRLQADAEEAARERAWDMAVSDAQVEYVDSVHGYRILANQDGDWFQVVDPDNLTVGDGDSFDRYRDAERAAQTDAGMRYGGTFETARFGQYSHPPSPGPGYRELLLTLPAQRPAHHGGHWDQANVLVHVRLSLRKTDGGKPVLLLEEVQSDWFQALRDNGAQQPGDAARAEAIVQEREQLHRQKEAVAPELQRRWNALEGESQRAVPALGIMDTAAAAEQNRISLERHEIGQRLETLQRPLRERIAALSDELAALGGRVPEGPFSRTEDYAALALKRMLRYAAEHGAEYLAWATGDMNAALFGVDRYVDALEWEPKANGRGVLSAYRADTAGVVQKEKPEFREEIAASALGDYVGSELAPRLEEKRWLGGDEFRVRNNQGMRLFYDRILPQEARRLAKKWGAQVEDLPLSFGRSQQEGWRYTGPAVSLEQIRERLSDIEYQARDPLGAAFLGRVGTQMRDLGLSFAEAVQGAPDPTEDRARRPEDTARARVGRLWGGRLEPFYRRLEESVHALPITPEMRQGIVQEGFPLFNAAGGAGGEFPRERMVQAWAGIRRGPLDILDYEGRLQDADARELFANPWVRQFAPALRQVYAQFARKLLSPEEQGRVRRFGLGFVPRPDGWVLGVNFPDVAGGNGAQGIFVDPFAPLSLPNAGDWGPAELARSVVLTLVHEMAHVQERGEGESFLQVLDRFHGQLGSDFDRAVLAVARTLRGATDGEPEPGTRSGRRAGFVRGYQDAALWHQRAFGVRPEISGGNPPGARELPDVLGELPAGSADQPAGGRHGPRLGGGVQPGGPGDAARDPLHPAGPGGAVGEPAGPAGGRDGGERHGQQPALAEVTPEVARVDQALREAFGHSAGATVVRRLGVRAAR